MFCRLFLLALACCVLVSWLRAEEKPAQQPPVKEISLPAVKTLRSKLLADLEKQSGVAIQDKSGDDTAIEVAARNVTFWQALDAIAAASKARIDFSSRTGRPILVPREGPAAKFVSYDGNIRICLKRVMVLRDLEHDQGGTNVTLEVAWLPDLLPLYLETQPHGLRLRDDKGKVIPLSEEGSTLAQVDGRTAFTFDIPLPALPRTTQQIGDLQGKLSMVAPTKMLTFDFGGLSQLEQVVAKAGSRLLTQDQVKCKIEHVVLTDSRWTITVSLDYPNGGKTFESYQSWIVNNELTLTSRAGKRHLSPSGYVLESSSSRKATVSYHFTDKPGNPRGKPADWLVSYRTPALLIDMPIAFSFKDIPLP